MLRNLLLLTFLAALPTSGCKKYGEIRTKDGNERAVEVFREVSTNYVETISFTIENRTNVKYSGWILDPFSDEKLRINLAGDAKLDEEGGFILKIVEPKLEAMLSYRFLDDVRLECLFVVASAEESKYLGQWRFIAERR